MIDDYYKFYVSNSGTVEVEVDQLPVEQVGPCHYTIVLVQQLVI